MSLWNRQNSKLVGAFLTSVGLPSVVIGLWMGHVQSTVIKTWPIVDAEVITSQVNATRGTTRTGFAVTRYEAEIVFRYTVGGKEYTSRSTPGYMTSRYSIMERIVDTYAPGTYHPIRYNPEYPNIVIFNAGYNFGFFLLPVMFGGMGLLFTVIGLITLKGAPAAQVGPGRPCRACGQALQPGQKFCSNCGRPVPAG
jgi:Protein of unknown function (DUF3592)/zinc-ribbon domain